MATATGCGAPSTTLKATLSPSSIVGMSSGELRRIPRYSLDAAWNAITRTHMLSYFSVAAFRKSTSRSSGYSGWNFPCNSSWRLQGLSLGIWFRQRMTSFRQGGGAWEGSMVAPLLAAHETRDTLP